MEEENFHLSQTFSHISGKGEKKTIILTQNLEIFKFSTCYFFDHNVMKSLLSTVSIIILNHIKFTEFLKCDMEVIQIFQPPLLVQLF